MPSILSTRSPNGGTMPDMTRNPLPPLPDGRIGWHYWGLGNPGRTFPEISSNHVVTVNRVNGLIHAYEPGGLLGNSSTLHYFIAVPAGAVGDDPLPSGFPSYPPLPAGYLRWEYLGAGALFNTISDYVAATGHSIDYWSEPGIGNWSGGGHSTHYIRAVKIPENLILPGSLAFHLPSAHVSRRPPRGVRKATLTPLPLP